MKHLHVISRASTPSKGETTPVETIIIVILSVYFRGWDNFISVVQNLSKFYQKT